MSSRLDNAEQRLITLQQEYIRADSERDALADALRRFQISANRVINLNRLTGEGAPGFGYGGTTINLYGGGPAGTGAGAGVGAGGGGAGDVLGDTGSIGPVPPEDDLLGPSGGGEVNIPSSVPFPPTVDYSGAGGRG